MFQFKPTTIDGMRFEDVTYHRNGVMGNGFYCAIANAGARGDMLINYFPPPENSESIGVYITVHSLKLLPDITAGVNSWRGDEYVGAMIKATKEWIRQVDEYNGRQK